VPGSRVAPTPATGSVNERVSVPTANGGDGGSVVGDVELVLAWVVAGVPEEEVERWWPMVTKTVKPTARTNAAPTISRKRRVWTRWSCIRRVTREPYRRHREVEVVGWCSARVRER